MAALQIPKYLQHCHCRSLPELKFSKDVLMGVRIQMVISNRMLSVNVGFSVLKMLSTALVIINSARRIYHQVLYVFMCIPLLCMYI